ncbi:hypothetical protein [Tenacibaculum salmonis]|uniref:hypothetical protein n=1 Tax=Tenacibaculum sp. P3-BQ1 TaxID=3232310 RepID=UPI0034DE1719
MEYTEIVLNTTEDKNSYSIKIKYINDKTKGQFYIHTNAKNSDDNIKPELETVSIYKSEKIV